MRDGFPGVEVFWANFGTIHNRVTAVQFESIVQFRQPLVLKIITGILDPPVCLHEHRRAEVFVSIPPVGRAGGAAACA